MDSGMIRHQLQSKNEVSNLVSVPKSAKRVRFRARVASLIQLADALSSAVRELEFIDLPEIDDEIDFYEEVRRFEIALIEKALRRTSGSQTKAAGLLKINTTTLNSKVKLYEITVTPKEPGRSVPEKRKAAVRDPK